MFEMKNKDKIIVKKPFAGVQKGVVAILCVVYTLFCWSCQNKSEADLPLSDEIISSNLSESGKIDPELLIGEWDCIKFAYTADGNKISNVANISNCQVTVADAILWHEDEELLDHEFSVYFKVCSYPYSRSGNKIKIIHEKIACFAINVPWTNVELEVSNSLKNANSFVIKGNELIIHFTGVKNKNLLILKNGF